MKKLLVSIFFLGLLFFGSIDDTYATCSPSWCGDGVCDVGYSCGSPECGDGVHADCLQECASGLTYDGYYCRSAPSCPSDQILKDGYCVPSCWTCYGGFYSSWIGDSDCDANCGENQDTWSACYSPACAAPTATPTPEPQCSTSAGNLCYGYDRTFCAPYGWSAPWPSECSSGDYCNYNFYNTWKNTGCESNYCWCSKSTYVYGCTVGGNCSSSGYVTPTTTPTNTPTPTISACASLPDCGSDLICDGSTCSIPCGSGQNKCLSSSFFFQSEKYGNKYAVCCIAPTPTPAPAPGLSIADNVIVSGSLLSFSFVNFQPNASVSVGVIEGGYASITADSIGSGNGSFMLGEGLGNYTLEAYDSYGHRATAGFSVSENPVSLPDSEYSFTPPIVSGDICTTWQTPYCTGANVCADLKVFDVNCNPPGFLCDINPFCKKYTGTECCTGASGGDLMYDYCQTRQFLPGAGNFCAYPSYDGMRCCKETIVTPTLTRTPTPSRTPTPTLTSICATSDTDGLGWIETCIGLGGPIIDYCDTVSSYRYAMCNLTTGCYYSPVGSSHLCPAGQLCRIKNTGEPECYTPSTPTPTRTPPTPTRTPTPTPTTIPCLVSTSPFSQTITIGETGSITATVTSGLGSASVSRMNFGSYNTTIATVNPTVDYTSPYTTSITPVSQGLTAIWATAILSDGRTCESTGTSDADIAINNPVQPPTPTNTPIPTTGTSIISGYVWLDGNENRVKDTSETCYSGSVTISISGPTLNTSQTYTQDSSCVSKYTFINLGVGNHTVSIQPIQNYNPIQESIIVSFP